MRSINPIFAILPGGRSAETSPLLQNRPSTPDHEEVVRFDDEDAANPRQWRKHRKYINVTQIVFLAFVCTMASSIQAPAADEIAQSFRTTNQVVLGAQAGFVSMLGIGPLLLAPLSETFGRRPVFLVNLAMFTLLQFPTALARDAGTFIAIRTASGFFGSVGAANGGGSVADMFETHERAMVLGIYLVAPLLGVSMGPLIGGVVAGSLHWRWIFFVLMISTGVIATVCFFLLDETNAATILEQRRNRMQRQHAGVRYTVEGASETSVVQSITQNGTRALRILTTQPIVMTMSLYQAVVLASMFSLYMQYSDIWSNNPYDFTQTEIGLAYLGPSLGFVITAAFIVAFIDRVYTYMARRNDSGGIPEYRLPLANIGAVFLPISLFWMGWSIEEEVTWPVPMAATVLFGASQVSIFNAVQTYYIDAFESSAASALAAGSFLRSVTGGVVPLFVGGMFSSLGYGWSMTVFGTISLVLMPVPLLFQICGKRVRERFPFNA